MERVKKNPVRQAQKRKPKPSFMDSFCNVDSDISEADDSVIDGDFIPDARDARDFFDDLEEDLMSQEEHRGLLLETIEERRHLEESALTSDKPSPASRVTATAQSLFCLK